MNVLKNMESIFAVAVVVTISATAIAKPRPVHTPVVASAEKVITVVVPGKRLSTVEKNRLAVL
ncbi:MAG: hypothetical protein ACLGI6_19090 [Gammaproteobacteria bacterium]